MDGFHRLECYLRYIRNTEEKIVIDADFRKYPTDKEFYLDAIRYNSSHGKNIEGSDRTAAIIKGRKLGISTKLLAMTLKVRIENVEDIIKTRIASVDMIKKVSIIDKEIIKDTEFSKRYKKYQDNKGSSYISSREEIPLKKGFLHLRKGLEKDEPVVVTPAQAAVIERSPGQNQVSLFRSVCNIIEVDLIDTRNDEVMVLIKRLKNLLNSKF